MGDFLGFTFGGYHSSDLGITRVSGGDRYNEQLFPEIKDRTAEVPGLNGEYYFGSDFGPRQFDIEIAYDHLTEEQFRKLRKVFGTREIKELIFDERPYKRYLAKLENPIELSFICFDEPKRQKFSEVYNIGTTDPQSGVSGGILTELPDGVRVAERVPTEGGYEIVREKVDPWVYDYEHMQRIYKGEGKISLICHFPFAKSAYKVLPSEEEGSDWVISSGLLLDDEYQSVDKFVPKGTVVDNEAVAIGYITLYNPGDLATGFRLYLPTAAINSDINLIYMQDGSNITASLNLGAITLETGDIGVLVDTNSELIVGVSSMANVGSMNATYTTSGHLYNQYITSGYFFKIEPNILYDRSKLQIDGDSVTGVQIFYDYLYF